MDRKCTKILVSWTCQISFVNCEHFSDDWYVECNENKTPNVNDETASRKKDVWNIYCQGEKISEFTYQKRKAAAKARFNISWYVRPFIGILRLENHLRTQLNISDYGSKPRASILFEIGKSVLHLRKRLLVLMTVAHVMSIDWFQKLQMKIMEIHMK